MDKENITEADKAKLRELYGKYKNRMYIAACRIVGDPVAAEDAVHDAFVAVSAHLNKIDDPDSVSTASYMIKAAKSRAYNILRKGLGEKEMPIDDYEAASQEDLLEEIASRQTLKDIVNAINLLDDRYRDVMSLYYFNEMSITEIADIMAIKENAVKQRLYRGRKKLINILEKENVTYG